MEHLLMLKSKAEEEVEKEAARAAADRPVSQNREVDKATAEAGDHFTETQKQSDHAIDSEETEDEEDHMAKHESNDDVPSDDAQSPSTNQKWEEMFQRLVDYRETHGHCLVPNRYTEDPQLGSWVSTQRRQYKVLVSGLGMSTPMTKDRVERLEQIGFEWSTRDPRHVPWGKRYSELCEFVKKYGHAQVPIGWKDNVQLSNWVSTQRQEYKLLQKGRNTRLTPERIEMLNKVKFIWEAQRGGPRRAKRAVVSVPEKPNPVHPDRLQKKLVSHSLSNRGRGGRVPSLAVQGASTSESDYNVLMNQRLHEMQKTAINAHLIGKQAVAAPVTSYSDGDYLGASYVASPGVSSFGNMGSLGVGPAQASASLYGLALNPALYSLETQAAMLSQYRQMPGLGLGGQIGNQTANAPNAWQMLPHGSFQQANPSALGIFPIATPLSIAAAGYQLGMIPTSMVQNSASLSLHSGLMQQSYPPADALTPKKKRRKHYRRKKSKKKRRKEKAEESEDESSDTDDDSEGSEESLP